MVAKLLEHTREVVGELHLEEVDITERPDVAIRYGVVSTPAIAINGRLACVGVPREGTLLARLRAAREEALG